MIIQCTSCEKKFNVPDSAITASGRLVQCSSCGNKWTQYPSKSIPAVKSASPSSPIKKVKPKKKTSKKTGPVPYSKEYMQQKWGTNIQSYAQDKGLSKKIKKISKKEKIKTPKKIEKIGFGFFNYIIVIFIFSTFFIGILNFERSRIGRKFPFLEPYIDHFFESLEIFKVLILDFFR
tara:strand:- start:9 stop:539 length:531 start_codon:yes stop_codon:yes gene_type:complete